MLLDKAVSVQASHMRNWWQTDIVIA